MASALTAPLPPASGSAPAFGSWGHWSAVYAQIFRIGIQNTLVYRWNFFIRLLAGIVPFVGSYYLWGAVFRETKEFGAYNFGAIMSYFLLMIILDALTAPTADDFQISTDIKDGLINQILLKPVEYFTYRLTLYAGSRVIYGGVAFLPMAGVMWCVTEAFGQLPWSETALPTVFAVILSGLLQFTMSYASAMLAFWLLEIGSVVFILYSLEFLAGGHVFPLDVLPANMYRAAMTLPFAYEYFFPVATAMGKIRGAALLEGFAFQIGWIVFFWALGWCLWQRGLKKFTAVGG